MEAWGLGSLVPPTDCKISGDLALTSLKGRVQGTPRLTTEGVILKIRRVTVLTLVH